MSIIIFKLVNGDDIISDVVVEMGNNEPGGHAGSTHYILKNPARLMMFPTEEGMGLGISPWCPYANKEEFKIDSKHVLLVIDELDVPEAIRNKYNDEFGSGIITPPTGLIL